VHLGSPSHSRPALKSCSVLECRSCGSRPPAARPRRAARDAPVGLFAEVLFIESSRSPTNWDCGIETTFRSQGDEWVQHCLATLGARTATVLTKRRLHIEAPLPVVRQEPHQLFEPLALLPHAVCFASPKIFILLCAEKIRATTYAHSGRPICCRSNGAVKAVIRGRRKQPGSSASSCFTASRSP
jgi:hypothetical protein